MSLVKINKHFCVPDLSTVTSVQDSSMTKGKLDANFIQKQVYFLSKTEKILHFEILLINEKMRQYYITYTLLR